MSRSFLLSLLTYVLLLVGIVTVHGEFLALALPLVTYLLVGYLQSAEKVQLKARLVLSAERVSPNTDVDITVNITNHGTSLEEVILKDVLPRGLSIRSGSNMHLVRLKKNESYS